MTDCVICKLPIPARLLVWSNEAWGHAHRECDAELGRQRELRERMGRGREAQAIAYLTHQTLRLMRHAPRGAFIG